MATGERTRALTELRALRAQHPLHAGAIEELALIGEIEDYADLKDAAGRALTKAGKGGEDRAKLLFAMARIAETPSDRARYLAEGNHAMAALSTYDSAAETALNAAIIAQTSESGSPLDPAPGLRTRPIFVLGLPRSGTTLAEAVLGAHPVVMALGERRSADLLYPMLERRQVFDAAQQARFVQADQAALPRMPADTTAYVDKMPENHRWIGFLKAAYPQAKIIHIRRDPRDTALSMWRSRFPTGALGYTYDWARMAHRFNLYAQMMAHWDQLYPGAIYDLPYEALVAGITTESRKLADHCGLDWVAPMARPDLHAGQIRTQSVHQLRQPVHTRSVGQWRQNADLLAPFVAGLDPVLWPMLTDS